MKILNDKFKNKYFTVLKYLFCFFIFFPYLTPVETPWSLQPYSFFFSLFVIFSFRDKKLSKQLIFLLLVSLLSILIAIFTLSRIDNSIRSIANYVSFPFIIWALSLLNPLSIEFKKFIKIAALIYFIVGLLQFTIMPGFLSFLVPHQGTSEELFLSGRGVSSLSPEPSYFGFIMLLFFFLGMLLSDKFLVVISLICILLLAKSVTVYICLFISLFIYFSFKNKVRFFLSILLMLSILIIFYFLIQNYASDARALILIQSFFTDGFSSTIDNDASATGRLYHIVYPITESFKNFLIPFGYNGLPNGDTRILSGVAGAIYELGFVSLILLYNILHFLFNKSSFQTNIKISVGLGMILFVLNANQIGMPIFCYIISVFIYTSKLYRVKNKTTENIQISNFVILP